MIKSIALTLGEPAGIGPDITLQLFKQQPDLFSDGKITILGNRDLLATRAKMLGLEVNVDTLSITDIPLPDTVIPGKLNPHNAAFVMTQLNTAVEGALSQKYAAIVTNPLHKGILNEAGFSIKGHTDFFARYTQSETVMMLMNDQLKIALLSDHLPLKEVPHFLTQERLSRCLAIIIQDCQQKLGLLKPHILVCGLNPHAGENGYLGTEEKDIIIPVVEQFRAAGHHITGPIGADVAFTPHYTADIILTMYHDQGLPVIKYAGFDNAINVTLGLPFIRSSVDHGTALDIAGTGKASTNSLKQAILFAISV